MTGSALVTIDFDEREGQVSFYGASLIDGHEFASFITNDVAERLNDQEGATEFVEHIRGLASTGFGRECLETILAAEIPERRTWAIGEAMAEAFLSREHEITWPWNMERDKRNPYASLPGADLIGFELKENSVRLAVGEVKTSRDVKTPPGVMSGRSGMTHQIDTLATNLSMIYQILRWLLPRCKGTEHESSFNAAVGLYLDSGRKDIALFGVLIREATPNVLDLQSRGRSLAGSLQDPTTCQLIAIYLPCAIADLPARVAGGRI